MAVTGPKPEKPTPDFPLFPHASGQWAKKIRGKLWYFGSWSDPTAALNRYLDERFEHEQGRIPKSREVGSANGCSGCSLKELANTFMISQDRRLKAGELSQRSFADYFKACKRILEYFGKETPVASLKGADFRAFRQSWPDTWGLQMHSDLIAKTKTVFGYALKNGLIDNPVNFGSDFDKPSKQQMRRKRQQELAERGTLGFTSEQIQALLMESSVVLKACILLGVNCGFGNSDCASLTERVVDLESGWIDFPRPKTGIPRRCKLWPETVSAITAALDTRPAPYDRADAGLCFLTSHGRPLVWHSLKDRKHSQTNNLTTAFGKVLKKHNLQKSGLGFYSLRRTFETVAGATKDQVAVDLIMGHADDSMAGIYRQGIEDSRLVAVTDHVRAWAIPAKPESEASA